VTLIAGEDQVLKFECEAVRKEIYRKLNEKKIEIVHSGIVDEIF
jgi:hypothetical protein